VYIQNPLRRYLFRRDFFKRAKGRLAGIMRKCLKDEFADQSFLLRDYPARIIFDGGANIGYVTAIYRKRFPQAHIFAFEPAPAVYEVLSERFASDENVKCFPLVLSEVSAETTFYVNPKTGSSSIHMPTDFNINRYGLKTPQPINTNSITLDDFCKSNNIEQIDILKLDIEGAEVQALSGARDLLQESRIGIIYTEATLVALYNNNQLFGDLITMLKEYDYRLFNMYDFGETAIRQGVIGNVIFTGPALREKLEELYGEKYCGW
jgi:FkbM family methyltransferase